MINIGLHADLHNFLADLWNAAEETGGNSRFFRPLSCWLESCTYEELPDYMKAEHDRGRILIYPLFPKKACDDMGYDRVRTLSERRPVQEKKQNSLSRWLQSCLE